ncbi:hypothetical protein BDV06DRAFT_222228 [Aspergillus oleicola]
MDAKKRTRNQNACDICRSRRVKCRFVDNEVVCEGCQFLGVSCTSDRPRRKRGPPNRYASKTISVFDREQSFTHPLSPASFPPSTSSTETPFLPGSPNYSHPHDILALLGPRPLIDSILGDWFTHIHPLAPVLHRRHFLARLGNNDANNDRAFCGLVISVICATCATLRRKSFAKYLPITIERCVSLVRSHDFLPADGPYTPDWCIAKYNLATASMAQKGLSDSWTHRTFGESVTGTRYLLTYRADSLQTLDVEMLKRLYCLLEISAINVDMLGQPTLGRLACDRSEPIYPHPYTDFELDALASPIPGASTNIQLIPSDKTTYVPGLMYLRSTFHTWHTCQTDRFYLPPSQVLAAGLSAIQTIIDTLPPELRWRGGLSRPTNAMLGHDVQIANVFITVLYVRSNLLQQFGDPAGTENKEEHQRIVSDLLEVLCHLPREILKANGYSLIPKIRDIGAAYLEVLKADVDGRLVEIGDEAREKMERLLGQLGILDFRPGVDGS